jgi:hypothetical protein
MVFLLLFLNVVLPKASEGGLKAAAAEILQLISPRISLNS